MIVEFNAYFQLFKVTSDLKAAYDINWCSDKGLWYYCLRETSSGSQILKSVVCFFGENCIKQRWSILDFIYIDLQSQILSNMTIFYALSPYQSPFKPHFYISTNSWRCLNEGGSGPN